MNDFKFSDDNKRYHTLSYHNRTTYGRKVFKAVIDAGFTCPNIDDSCGKGGCIFCDGGSGYFTEGRLCIKEQLELERKRIHKKNPDALICAYFQANTNTYADTDTLRERYYEAIDFGADSIAVATRGDCITEENAELLGSLPIPVTVELGLQSIHDKTAELINRGHTYDTFLNAYKILRNKGIRLCVHIINGLPGESMQMMLRTAKTVGELRPDGIKIHLLHVIKGTVLGDMYERGEYTPLTKEEYVDITVRQLELLPPETVIERITGDGDKKKLMAPLWSMDKISVLGAIDVRQKELMSFQGKEFLL